MKDKPQVTRNEIRNFAVKSAIQSVLSSRLDSELQKVAELDVELEPSLSEFHVNLDSPSTELSRSKNSKQKSKKTLKREKKLEEEKERRRRIMLEKKRDIWGVRRDGFDLYKPSKKLKCIGVKDGVKAGKKIDGILERKVGKIKSLSKNRLYKEVFLDSKKAELNKLEFQHLEKYPIEEQKKLADKKELWEINNKNVRKEFMKTTIVQPTGHYYIFFFNFYFLFLCLQILI